MKLISWNVAGFRACLKKGFETFWEEVNADIICLQEVKALPEQIPFDPPGYHCYLNPAERKGYSGVMVYSKRKPISVVYGMGIEEHDHEGRMITLEYETFYLINVYVPNVKRGLERLAYRMEWEDVFRHYVAALNDKKPVVICGDFNVAHQEIDIKNAKQNIGNAGFTDEERSKFSTLLASGFIDTYRYYYPDQTDVYSWWSYMPGVRDRNIGWRIDYFLVSESFITKVYHPKIYMDVYGSDHCPIGLEMADES